jgi:hypothetical protein
MCDLYFFVHVVEYTIVVAKTTMLSSIDGLSKLDDIVHFFFTFSMKIVLVVSCSNIYN